MALRTAGAERHGDAVRALGHSELQREGRLSPGPPPDIRCRSAQQASRCADCHFAQNNVSAQDHLFDWDRSPHARNNVGCGKCHGGNSTVFEAALAHRGILNSGNAKNPVHRANLLSPAALEKQCSHCHGATEVAPRAERARNARAMYESLNAVREQLKLANAMIKKVDDKTRRASLMDEYEQPSVPMARAINAGHKFVYAELDEHLKVAQLRVEKLMSRIVNRSN